MGTLLFCIGLFPEFCEITRGFKTKTLMIVIEARSYEMEPESLWQNIPSLALLLWKTSESQAW